MGVANRKWIGGKGLAWQRGSGWVGRDWHGKEEVDGWEGTGMAKRKWLGGEGTGRSINYSRKGVH